MYLDTRYLSKLGLKTFCEFDIRVKDILCEVEAKREGINQKQLA